MFLAFKSEQKHNALVYVCELSEAKNVCLTLILFISSNDETHLCFLLAIHLNGNISSGKTPAAIKFMNLSLLLILFFI